MKALVTGATGFVGRKLVARLNEAVVLSRNAERARRELPQAGIQVYPWEPQAGPPPKEAFDGVEAVFHLAGESVADGRWTDAKKQRIRDSRVVGTRNLVSGIEQLSDRPEVLVSASAVGFYDDRGDQALTETASVGDGFLAEVSHQWEQESQRAGQMGLRVANPRIGIALGTDGGALPRMVKLFRLGLGSPLGSGRQWMSWIHIDDLVALFLFAAGQGDIQGPINAVSPRAVTNRDFTKELAKALHRIALLPPVPGFALKIALGEFADVLLASQKVIPEKALAAGFAFQYASLEEALHDLFG